ncbi:hypothetical protein FHX12_000374 [Rhizobium sp. BK609]|nr:hypothetical protein [Rhizobium sp. BK098]MBB3613426.1 hypothetical protein [Rhizobium sp. BK609]MBB3679084.1 hypothetical protein [Rhizobium sp. BK612]
MTFSELLLHGCEEFCDELLVALVENPLAEAPGRHQAGTVKRAEVGRDGGLRETAPLKLAGADTKLQRVFLRRKMGFRIFQVVEDFEPGRIGQRLQYLVFVHGTYQQYRIITIYVSMIFDISRATPNIIFGKAADVRA